MGPFPQQGGGNNNTALEFHPVAGSFQPSPTYPSSYSSIGQPGASCHQYSPDVYSSDPCYFHPPSGLIRSGAPSSVAVGAGPFSSPFPPSQFHHLHHPIPTYGVPPYPYGHGSLGAPCTSAALAGASIGHNLPGGHRTSALAYASSTGPSTGQCRRDHNTSSNLPSTGPNSILPPGSSALGPIGASSLTNSHHPHPHHPHSHHPHHILHHTGGQTSIHTSSKVPAQVTTMRSSPFPDPGDYHEKPRKRRWQEFPGRNRFYCDGRIMMAKQISVFYFTVTLLVVTVTLFFVFE